MRIEIQANGIDVTAGLRAHVRCRLHFAVGRFADRIARVTVRLSDLNGPRVGMVCRLQIRLHGMPDVLIGHTEADLDTAVSRVADRARREVGWQLERALVEFGTQDRTTGRRADGTAGLVQSASDEPPSPGASPGPRPARQGAETAASLLLLVRGMTDLKRACSDLSGFLAFRHRRRPEVQEDLLGVWIDQGWVARTPHELRWPEADGASGIARMRETVGVDGIWMLCWLELRAGGLAPSRRSVLASLAAAFPAEARRAPAFAPVFSHDTPAREVEAELRCLAEGCDFVALVPVFQHAGSGRLETPPWQERPGRERAQPLRRGGLDPRR